MSMCATSPKLWFVRYEASCTIHSASGHLHPVLVRDDARFLSMFANMVIMHAT